MVKINGQELPVAGKTISEYLAQTTYHPQRLAIERNGEIVPKAEYESMYTGVFYARYMQGLWVRAEGLDYPMFDRAKHIVHRMPDYSRRHRYYVAIDYGTVNPFAAGLYALWP